MPTIGDLPIGAKLKFGAYCVGDEMPHRICWLKVHHDGTLLCEFIEDQLSFDVTEPENPSGSRAAYGNNRYSVSNIQQFCNADGYDWFQKKHEYDHAPTKDQTYDGKNGYDLKPGFLYYFDPLEIDAIEMSEIKTSLPEYDISDGCDKFETIYAKVFIPSRTNLNNGTNNRIMEGETWDIFQNSGCAARLSPELFANTTSRYKPDREDNMWYYFLRSPDFRDPSIVNVIDSWGDRGTSNARDNYIGIRPALKLNLETTVSDEPDEDGYFEVLVTQQDLDEINEEDFFEILKPNK